MNRIIKFSILLLFLLFRYYLSSQEVTQNDVFRSEILKKANQHKSDVDFYKSASFFVEEEWDSTLVYAMRYLNTAKQNIDLTDYSHYFRGFSFLSKSIYQEAEREFKLISPKFEYYPLVKMRLGQIALEQHEFEKAISYFKELIGSPKDVNNNFFIRKGDILENIGLCYLHLKNFNKAEPYLLQSAKDRELKKDTLALILTYGNIANLYYEQYKDDMAIPYFEKAYRLSKNIKAFNEKLLTSMNMAVVEENRKNFQKALVYRKEYEQWKDSLNDQNKIYEVAQIEKEFAVKQKQQEVNLLEAENKAKVKERNSLLYSAVTLLILLGVTFYFYKEKNKTNKIILAQKARLDELNVAKDKLFSIVSHDLRSSVNALKMSNTKLLDDIGTKNLDTIKDALQNNSSIVNGAYNLLDNLLHWALLQTKQSYFHIESLRLFFIVEQVAYNYKAIMEDKGIDFSMSILKTDKVFADQESLKIVLRNLLDNAIKFSEANDSIKIYTEHPNGIYCNLIVEDSGLGMSKTTLETLQKDTGTLAKKEHEGTIGTGLGLQLCKSYIKKNNSKFTIESTLGKGTKMVVSLPKTTPNA
ncbi:tetratricopeptide repeat-containing sensor histidine kinase [Hyunsoonleella pacifica]|uniref:histidine kinase n=1 Tax=Hyunsoonleella pacifica TaxID=1080224 RepID=A0A4Q9FLB3_9FLAO|nr:tetratricopeptide repeat-containing sensor histidine kinase [Hyunsoonleella pacifica]TBN14463.1 tetratricopeptide repeat protein [Hyunsoonleella pacifica]GGD13936.1 hypothetical protein GCM10011368_14920 [Hyunsoonleella pacifica]